MTSVEDNSASPKGTIRFEDLGEPVQRLLKSIKGGVSDDDMALLEYVSVKDMAKIYSEMASDRHAEEIWEELRGALEERRDRAAQRERELEERKRTLLEQQQEELKRQTEQEKEEEEERRANEEALERRRDELRRQKNAEDAEAEAAAAIAAQEAAEEEEAARREEERRKKADKKRKRREARARELQEEQEAIEAEQARQKAKKSSHQKKQWEEYVHSHPLQFSKRSDSAPTVDENVEIEQEKVRHCLNAPPKASESLLTRTYSPKCPQCGATFASPPPQWKCPFCERNAEKIVMVWQPDSSSNECMVCHTGIGRWSRHHCRSCGRLTCSNCTETRAIIDALGYAMPVKVCDDCARMRTAQRTTLR